MVLIRVAGIKFPAKHAAAPAVVHDPEISGSLINVSLPFDPNDCEKSPCSSRALGITPSWELPEMPRKLSQLARKNVLSWPSYSFGITTGPVIDAPNWFLLSLLLSASKKLRASSRSFRKYSNTAPWYWLPPDLSAIVTTPPASRPYSAE